MESYREVSRGCRDERVAEPFTGERTTEWSWHAVVCRPQDAYDFGRALGTPLGFVKCVAGPEEDD